jgi:glycosyltransferase involved in cell wall biosynthesis
MKVNFISEAEIINNYGEGIWAVYKQQLKGLMDSGLQVSSNKFLFDDTDVVHIHTFGTLAYMKASITKKPLVISTHTLPNEAVGSVFSSSTISNFFEHYLPRFYSKADIIVSPSKFTKESLKKYNIKKPIFVVSNGVDTKKFRFSKAKRIEFRKKHGIKEREIVVYCVGQIIMRKGVDKFIKLARAFPDIKFIWVGRRPFGKLSGDNKKIDIFMKKAPRNVVFTGFVDDVVAAHCAGDIFLLATSFENECIALLEAAAVGNVVLVSNLPTFDEWLTHGKNCIKCDSYESFRDKLKMLIKNDNLREKIGKNAIKMAKKKDIRNVSKNLVRIYKIAMNIKKRENTMKTNMKQKLTMMVAFMLFTVFGILFFMRDRVYSKILARIS